MNILTPVSQNLVRWSVSAEECYMRGCICEGCKYVKLTSDSCRMKSSVLVLVRKYGIPPKLKRKEIVIEDE